MNAINDYYDVLMKEINRWIETAIESLPNIVLALFVVILFVLIAAVTKRLVTKTLSQVTHSEALVSLGATVARVILMVIGVIIALGVLGLQQAAFSLLAGAGVIGLALGFAFQDLAANFIAGIFMAIRRPFDVGDVIASQDTIGVVKGLNMRNTLIENFNNQLVIIPNKVVFENKLTNYTATGKRMIEVQVGVTYGADLQKVYQLLKSVQTDLHFVHADQSHVWAAEFGGSSINFNVKSQIDYPDGKPYLEAIHEIVVKIKQVFDAHQISIPFPIRTLDFSLSKHEPLGVQTQTTDH